MASTLQTPPDTAQSPMDALPGDTPGERKAGAPDTRRLLFLVALLLLVGAFAMGALSWASFARQNGTPVGLFTQTDFPAIVIASRLAAAGDGSRLYDLGAQLEGQQRLAREGYLSISPGDTMLHYPYPYAPFVALFWAPFTSLDPLASMAIWDLLNIAAMAAGLWFLLRELPLPGRARALLAIGGLTSFAFIVNLEQGQSSGPVALGMAMGTVYLLRGRDLPAGLWLGLLFLKLQWLPFVLLALLLKGRWKALVGMALTGLTLALAATLALGPGWIPAYAQVLTSTSRNASAFLLTPSASHSLNGGIYALLGPANEGLVGPLSVFGVLVLAAIVIWAWVPGLRGLFRSGGDEDTWRPEYPAWYARWGLTLLAAMLANLQLNTHDLSLLVVPAALGFAWIYATGAQGWPVALWQACAWALYLAPLLLLGRGLLDATNPMPVRATTWLMVGMFAILATMGGVFAPHPPAPSPLRGEGEIE